MDSQEIISKDKQFIMSTYGRYDAVLTHGENAKVYDLDGKSYIDLTSGIGVNSLGYCDKDWADAISKQAMTLNHTSNLYFNEPCVMLAERLCELTGMSKVFFCNSGAEANECAIKLARKYSYDKYGEDRNTIVSLVNSFHGRTIATLSATGQDVFHDYFFPFVDNHEYLEANKLNAIDKALHNKVCAVIIELIQGESGVNVLNAEFVKRLRKLTYERDIILIVDEVQTGIGRTGYLTACEYFNVIPDVITLAKGLGGGLPIGCCLANNKLSGVFVKGNHGTTFGGNPIVCAGALAVLDKVSDKYFLMKVQSNGKCIVDFFNDVINVVGITGVGLMVGIEIMNKTAQQAVQEAFEQGVLVLTAKNKIRLLPPLTIDFGDLLTGLKILKNIIENK